MAYVAGDYRFHVKGSLLGEIFDNTWSARFTDPSPNPQTFVDILHDLYEDIYAVGISDDTHALACSFKELSTGSLGDGTWADLNGDTATPMLPTQCSIRVSISAGSGTRGGPFIAGWHRTALGTDGQTLDDTSRNNLVTSLNTFWAAADAAGWTWCLDLATTHSLVAVLNGRVGHRFDVIRKRANDIGEAFVGLTAP